MEYAKRRQQVEHKQQERCSTLDRGRNRIVLSLPDAAEVMEVAKSYEDSKGEDFTFEITEHIGVLKTNASGWSKEFNVVSWNGNPGKFDIREWSEDHKKMSKGITLTDREAKMLHGWIGKQRLHAESE
jgi:hypothetical protein